MDFRLSDEQHRLREEVVRFAKRELNDDVVLADQQGIFPMQAWKKCAEFGIQGLAVPQEYGGAGTDALTICIAMEALGYGVFGQRTDLLDSTLRCGRARCPSSGSETTSRSVDTYPGSATAR